VTDEVVTFPSLLQDEAEGYECQRLSKWFASRLDAREVVRKYHERNQNDTLSTQQVHTLNHKLQPDSHME